MKGIIIGGASRSGKSSLAKMLTENSSRSWYPVDPLITCFDHTYPELGLTHNRLSDNEIAIRFDKFLSKLIEDFEEHLWNKLYRQKCPSATYVIDTCYILPETAKKFSNIGIEILFLGYATTTPHEKLHAIRDNELPGDWTREREDSELMEEIKRWIDDSKDYKLQCEKLGLGYIDTSQNFKDTLQVTTEEILSSIKEDS